MVVVVVGGGGGGGQGRVLPNLPGYGPEHAP